MGSVFLSRRGLIAAFCALIVTAAAPGDAAEIWFAPILPRPDVAARLRANPGNEAGLLAQLEAAQTDWDRFFTPAMLDRLAPAMQVYAVGTGAVLSIPDAELKVRLDALSARHVRLAFVAQPVISSDPSCGHTEGYEDIRNLDAAIAKLKRLDIGIAYLAMDGGLWYGHYAAGDQECHLSLAQTVAQVAVTTKAFATAFPGIVIGDIEPTVPLTREPDWQDSFRVFKVGLEVVTGAKLSFLQLDIAWNNPDWPDSVRAETALARSMGMQVGYIYNGDGEDRSDAVWLAHARRNIAAMEGGLGLIPDQAEISSWNEHPVHSIGAPDETTLASLLSDYAKPGLRVVRDGTPGRVSGHVQDAAGRPVAGIAVTLAAAGVSQSGAVPIHRIEGRVPERARAALLGLRINTECLCAGRNDLVMGNVRYDESGDGGHHETTDFLPQFRHFEAFGGVKTAKIHVLAAAPAPLARITAGADDVFGLTGSRFSVTPGAAFTLSVPLLDLLGTPIYGTVTVIWLDATGQGFKRDNMVPQPDLSARQTAVTDGNGRFVFAESAASPGALIAPTRLAVEIGVADQKGYRGAVLAAP